MPTMASRAPRLFAVLLLPLLACACVRRLPDADPADIPALRAELAARPQDPGLLTRLGIALYKAGEHEQAIATLTPVVEMEEASGAAHLYLGLSYEEREDWRAAREAYSRYIDTGRFDPVKDQLRGRLAILVRRELQDQARRALAQEAQLSAQPPTPRSVAVFPFRLVSDSEELEPLQVALADMMITDLTLSGGLTVLERTQIQSLLNEMALNEAGYTDDATGARAGRLLRAEHVVQGALTTLGDDALRFDADVLETQGGAPTGDVTGEEPIASLFDLEKAVVFQVLDILGVEITPAERELINQNRAENLLAFLAYGQGLQALDRGDYQGATQFFGQAIQLDPGFNAARVQGDQTNQMEQASGSTTGDVAQAASTGGGAVSAPPQTPATTTGAGVSGTLANVDQGVNPSPTTGTIDLGSTTTGGGAKDQGQQRDAVQESQGNEGVTKTQSAKIIIQIRRPGGGD